MLFNIITIAVCAFALGFISGRIITKTEFGKMLVWLEVSGYLHRPNEDTDDEEDIK